MTALAPSGDRLAPGFVAHDPAFAQVTGPAPRLVEVIATDAHEGPVYVPAEDALYFSTARPDVAVKRLALDGESFPVAPSRLSTLRASTDAANGMTLGRDGRLLVCEQGTPTRPAGITAIDPETGRSERLVERWRGRTLSSPNDVVVARDGAIWFTDPSYGHLQGFRPPPALADAVYRLDPRTRGLAMVTDRLDKPNGLAFSPDERVLYVGDNGAPHRLLAFDVLEGRRLARERVLAVLPPEHPDGVKVDRAGRIYVSAPTGVRVLAPDGAPLGEIALPGAVNFAWGGPRGAVLFITTDTAIWAAVLNTRGT